MKTAALTLPFDHEPQVAARSDRRDQTHSVAGAGRLGCSGSLTIFVKRFTISKTGAELFAWPFVLR